ncbi:MULTISPECIES: GNAT family N-acetyltransferase [unclassified Streptomyces]|uniref:GNAT family N-acetyltransferase n=1 Tax=unclassified Streptomyces TaxID=2593676 RepID=UPI002E32D6DC|nr:GNAT family N-acetyltransferase [Streptomyces sp. NBC_01431]
MEPVTLTTERLLLRPVGPEHADATYAACQDPDIQRWTTVPSPYLREHAESFTSNFGPDGWRNDTDYTFAVLTADDTALVAVISVTRRGPGLAELGFWAVKEHRGNGYMTEAASAAARWAFEHAAVDRLEWRAVVGNEASRAVALRAGFTMEGTLRSAALHRGTRLDSWLGALLPSDMGLPGVLPHLPAQS